MNRTGGPLARHSRRKGWNKDEARQKTYFATARSGLGRKRNAKPSVLAVEDFVPGYVPRDTETNNSSVFSGLRIVDQEATGLNGLSRETPSAMSHTFPRYVQKSPKRKVYSQNLSEQLVGSPDFRQRNSSDVPNLSTQCRKLLEQSDWTGIKWQQALLDRTGQGEHLSTTSPLGTSPAAPRKDSFSTLR